VESATPVENGQNGVRELEAVMRPPQMSRRDVDLRNARIPAFKTGEQTPFKTDPTMLFRKKEVHSVGGGFSIIWSSRRLKSGRNET
jgi:hypothetical protein